MRIYSIFPNCSNSHIELIHTFIIILIIIILMTVIIIIITVSIFETIDPMTPSIRSTRPVSLENHHFRLIHLITIIDNLVIIIHCNNWSLFITIIDYYSLHLLIVIDHNYWCWEQWAITMKVYMDDDEVK